MVVAVKIRQLTAGIDRQSRNLASPSRFALS